MSITIVLSAVRLWKTYHYQGLSILTHMITNAVFYQRDAMLARVIAIATCLSVRPSVRLSRAGIVSKRRKLAS